MFASSSIVTRHLPIVLNFWTKIGIYECRLIEEANSVARDGEVRSAVLAQSDEIGGAWTED
jgi:hypothetical protein